MSKDTYEILKNQIDCIQNEGRDLTEWEENFIKSVVGQFKMKGWLSPKQCQIVERIYSEKCPTGSAFGEPADGAIQRFKARETHGGSQLPSQRNPSRLDRIRNEGR